MRILLLLCLALPGAFSLKRSYTPSQQIVGATEAADGAWPWMASLQIRGSHSCGVVLIKATYALTAASCVGGSVAFMTVVFGTNQRSCPDPCTSKQPTTVERHPDYANDGARGYPNDIAVISWTVPALQSPGKVSFANLGTASSIETNCWLAGWGRTSSAGTLPENLQESKVDSLSTGECQSYYGATSISDSQVCVFDRTNQGVAMCNGDAGGPLSCQQSGVLGRWEVVGIISWGRTGCDPSYPTVGSRVSAYADWINTVTGGA